MSEHVASPLPDEMVAPASRRRVVMTILGTLLAVTLVNVAFLWHLQHFAERSEHLTETLALSVVVRAPKPSRCARLENQIDLPLLYVHPDMQEIVI